MPECFTIMSEEIENRIDPHFYRPEFIEFYKKLEKTKFEFKTIGEISEKVTSGATPLSKGDSYTTQEDGIPFVRSGDINEDKTINFDVVIYIKKDIHEKKLKGSQLKKGEGVWKGEGNNLSSQGLTFDFDIWKEGDGNCCPSAGYVTGEYELQRRQTIDGHGGWNIVAKSFKRHEVENKE